jgi:hypothetical protein
VDEFVGKLAAGLLEALRSMGPGMTVGLLSPAAPEPPWPVAPGVTDPEEVERLVDQWADEAVASQSPRERLEGLITAAVWQLPSLSECPQCGRVFRGPPIWSDQQMPPPSPGGAEPGAAPDRGGR